MTAITRSTDRRGVDIPWANTIVDSATSCHHEIINTETMEVWQALEPSTLEAFEAMEVEAPWAKVATGFGRMDESYFRRSPGMDEDGPMATMEAFGFVWSHCANPDMAGAVQHGENGPREISVHKYHTMIFHGGHDLDILCAPDGNEYVHIFDTRRVGLPKDLPDGYAIRSVHLEEKIVLDLGYPATVFFFPDGNGFQGPLDDFK